MEYEEIISCDGKDETITFSIPIPLTSRLAELIERSAIRDFYGYYDEAAETIVLKGETVHTVI